MKADEVAKWVFLEFGNFETKNYTLTWADFAYICLGGGKLKFYQKSAEKRWWNELVNYTIRYWEIKIIV